MAHTIPNRIHEMVNRATRQIPYAGTPLIGNFTTLELYQDPDHPNRAFYRLQVLAALVAPLMRKHNWTIGSFEEFVPDRQSLLGQNHHHGKRISIRLRHVIDPQKVFIPVNKLVFILLHELAHNEFSGHGADFEALLDELKEEFEATKCRMPGCFECAKGPHWLDPEIISAFQQLRSDEKS